MSGIVIVGASGRMGRALIEAVIETEEATLVGGNCSAWVNTLRS